MKNIDYDNDFPLDYLEIQLLQHFLEIQLLQHYLEIQLLQQTIVILRTTHNEAIKLYQLLLLYYYSMIWPKFYVVVKSNSPKIKEITDICPLEKGK